jgi:hypothetical protein
MYLGFFFRFLDEMGQQVTLQNIANVLDTPIFVRNVPVLDHINSLSFLLSLARHDGVGGSLRYANHNRQHSRILATLLSAFGWHTDMPKEHHWRPYTFLRYFPAEIKNIERLSLNQIVGAAHRSQRSRSLLLSSIGPSDPAPINPNVRFFQQRNSNQAEKLPVVEVGRLSYLTSAYVLT